MGTFVKDEKLTEASLGTKTVYKQERTTTYYNKQYYLEGSENDGWKVIFPKSMSLHYFQEKMLLAMKTYRLVC